MKIHDANCKAVGRYSIRIYRDTQPDLYDHLEDLSPRARGRLLNQLITRGWLATNATLTQLRDVSVNPAEVNLIPAFEATDGNASEVAPRSPNDNDVFDDVLLGLAQLQKESFLGQAQDTPAEAASGWGR